MSAPLLWVILPGFIAVGLYTIRQWRNAIYFIGLLVALLLAGLAWRLPIEEPISLHLWPGFPAFKVGESITIFNRPLELNNIQRPALIMIYLGLGFWFGGAYQAGANRLFIPLGLGIAALMTASIAVTPGYYGVLIVELMAFACVPILSPPGKPLNRGITRFLVFQTFGVGLILLGDLSLPVIGVASENTSRLSPVSLLISLGFLIMIGAFPFHSWIPMIIEQANPYASVFVFYIIPTTLLLLALEYLSRYTRLGVPLSVYASLRPIGVMMILIAGAWAAFERHLGRILGFAAILQIGSALLAISLGDRTGQESSAGGLFFAQLLPQAIGLAVWAQALCAIRDDQSELTFDAVRGKASRLPLATISLVLANFSLAGLPLLASFPVDLAVWSGLAQRSSGIALLALIGNVFLFIAAVRTLAVLLNSSSQDSWQFSERSWQRVLLVLGMIMLFVVGLMPQWFIPTLTNMGMIFSAASP
jgi:NADH-quinone oxidoreductase subunit N